MSDSITDELIKKYEETMDKFADNSFYDGERLENVKTMIPDYINVLADGYGMGYAESPAVIERACGAIVEIYESKIRGRRAISTANVMRALGLNSSSLAVMKKSIRDPALENKYKEMFDE